MLSEVQLLAVPGRSLAFEEKKKANEIHEIYWKKMTNKIVDDRENRQNSQHGEKSLTKENVKK